MLLACAASASAQAVSAPGNDPGRDALCGDGPLDILLTNDDGVTAAGVRALRAQLAAAGHRVTLAAPDHNASGTSVSFTWGEVPVTPDPDDPSVFAVGASPATSVVIAANVLYPSGTRPDLVISGINHGPNSGALLMLSGTLGAALAGTVLLDPPVPGFAVSAERLHPAEPMDSPANRAQLEAVAVHFSHLVSATRGWFCERGRVVRARTVLNVNYPAVEVASLRGTVVARQSSATGLSVDVVPAGESRYRARTEHRPADGEADSDLQRLLRGYATVTPVNARLGADEAPGRKLRQRLRRL
jgi:5'-nucleotidase